MAQFLILAKNTTRTRRVIGDPVDVFEDERTIEIDWPGTFYLITVPGITVAQVEKFMDKNERAAVEGVDPEFNDPDPADRVVRMGRHRWTFNITELTTQERNTLEATGKLTINFNRNKLNRLVTDRQGLEDFN